MSALANPRRTYCADSVSRGCSLRRAENFAVRGRSLSRSFVARARVGIASRLNRERDTTKAQARYLIADRSPSSLCSFSVALDLDRLIRSFRSPVSRVPRCPLLGLRPLIPLGDSPVRKLDESVIARHRASLRCGHSAPRSASFFRAARVLLSRSTLARTSRRCSTSRDRNDIRNRFS